MSPEIQPEPAVVPSLPFTRTEFNTWYDAYTEHALKPAAAQIERSLKAIITQAHADDPRGRMRLNGVRIKSVNRAWSKLEKPKYADSCTSLDDVPDLIDDLLGLRIVCTNLEDLEDLNQELSLHYRESTLSRGDATTEDFVTIESGSGRDYLTRPKGSGYRASHLNLRAVVGMVGGGWQAVRAELQVRTLLQDAWGELTHEDTYKPDSEVSEFVETLSLRMAEMLAVVDSLAQDIRSELDQRIAESIDDLAADLTSDDEHESIPEPDGNELYEAVERYVNDLHASLDHPMPLATLAFLLQGEFGSELREGWLGFGKMTPMLQNILPQDMIVTEIPGLLLPPGFSAENAPKALITRPAPQLPPDVAAVALRLRLFDSTFPMLSCDAVAVAYKALSESHNAQRAQYGRPDIRYVNLVTKLARDLAQHEDRSITRADLNYICRGLLFKQSLDHNLTPERIATIYSNMVVERFRRLKLFPSDSTTADAERDVILRWLGGRYGA